LIGRPTARPRRQFAEVSRVIATRTFPALGALVIVLVLWEGVVLLKVWPPYLLPPPGDALGALGDQLRSPDFYMAVAITLGRAASGYLLALVIGTAIGVAMAVVPVLRRAVGSLITGLQTMPSVAWFPFAILLFKLSEGAILFVVVLGAAPSIANGIISGIDNVPTQLTSAARILGARGIFLYRRVILPAAMPYVLAGLKQAWAFAWRSLMAGELIVIVAGKPSLGARMQFARDFNDATTMVALLMVLLVIGILVDQGFGLVDRRVRARRGLVREAA
jgi:NitT/TauT family transport system permease protein